jgi:acetolactate synthase-1/2/3 large subunit
MHLQKLARQIAARNIPFVFGIPGSGPSLDLLDALETLGVGFHLTHFEGTAALMAGAVGKLSGKSGVAVSIKGPGLTNMLPGLAACKLDAFPVVSISEAYLPDAPRKSTHKRLDHAALVSAVAKQNAFLSANGPAFEQLAALAEAEIPGVVHLDLAAKPASSRPFQNPPLPETDPGAWDDIHRQIGKSATPVVIAGSLAVRLGLPEELNRLEVPVFSTAAAKGVVDERLPHAAGVYTGVGGPLSAEKAILPQADLVIGIGLRHNEVLSVGPFDCPSVGIDPLGEKHSFGIKWQQVAGGTIEKEWLGAVFDRLSHKSWGGGRLARNRNELTSHMLRGSFLPAHVYHALAGHFQSRARLVLDTGNFCTIGEHAWAVPRPDLYLASAQGRYMGTGLPLAVGAALYDRTVPTICFCGDGGIGMFAAEIKLAVQNRLPLIVVLFTDAHLGTIRGGALQKALTQQPTVIHRPSWVEAFSGMGAAAERIESVAGLEKTLAAWAMEQGPLFLEAAFDPDAYQRMTDGIR